MGVHISTTSTSTYMKGLCGSERVGELKRDRVAGIEWDWGVIGDICVYGVMK